MKSLARKAAMQLPVARMEQLYAHSLHGHIFADRLEQAITFSKRPELWADLADRIGTKTKILYLEFGVFAGESMRVWTQLNQNPESSFVGFDTFEGLPESWAGLPKGYFSTDGNIPVIDDTRVRFEKGLFQATVGPTFRKIDFSKFDQVVVHFDADLFSSTVFSLTQILQYSSEFYAIFDEFAGDEARAYFALERAYALDAQWFAQVIENDRPVQVSCHIKSDVTR
jgi:hypothetical protein